MKTKILLISSIPPCKNYTAGIVLHNFVSQFPEDTFVSVALLSSATIDARLDKELNIENLEILRPNDCGINLPPSIYKKFRAFSSAIKIFIDVLSFMLDSVRMFKARTIVLEICKFAIKSNVTKLWIHMDTPHTIRIAARVAKKLKLPVHVSVFDEPKWYMRVHNMDRWSQKEVIEVFSETIQQSVSCATASLPMAEEYERQFNVKSVPIMHSYKGRNFFDNTKRSNDGFFVIAMAGQMYALSAINSLFSLLDSVGWVIDGLKVIFRYYGPYFYSQASVPRSIEYLGWHSQDDVISGLSKCDILYCPYPFEEELAEVSRTSFPSKIIPYLATGVPILFHGPSFSSVAKLFDDKQCGHVCSSLEHNDIFHSISKIRKDEKLNKIVLDNAKNVLNSLFGTHVMRENLSLFLDLDTK